MIAKEYSSAVVARNGALEWCVLLKSKDRFQVTASGTVNRPAEDAASEVAAAFRKELLPLKPPVVLGIPSDQALLRVVALPTQDDAELAGMVQIQVDKVSPFPVEGLVVSHEVLQRKADGTVVLIGAVREAVIDGLGKALGAGGVTPARVDVTVLGWWRVLRDAGELGEPGRKVVILLHDGTADLIVVQDGCPVLFRSLAVGSGEVAEEDLTQEVSFTLMALELEHGPQGPCPIVLWHRGGEPTNLQRALHSIFMVEVTVKPLDKLASAAEGLARRAGHREGMDLTPASWRQAAGQSEFRRRLWTTIGAAAGVWVAAVSLLMGGIHIDRLRLQGLQSELKRLQVPANQVRETRRRVMLIKRYTNRDDSALECLREISSRQPAGINLTSFTYRKGEGIRISGEAQTVDDVYTFKKSVDEVKTFKSATLQGPQDRGGKQLFDMDIKLPGTGGGEP